MTMNKIFAKLRQKNKGQYRMLGFCIFLSVLLVTAFTLMYYGPTVQNFLPEGGDTRKMASLLLGVTAVGCSIFTVYASTLFFRYKSREYGIFLALGEPKKALVRLLFRELASIAAAATLLGLIAAIPASWLIWKLFQLFLVSTEDMVYHFGASGFLAGIGFAVILALLLGLAGRRFVKNSDIMDILKAEHKTEMVKEIKSWTFPVGILLILLGLFLGMVLPQISARVFAFQFPAFSNLFYLLSLVGVYFVLLNIVAQGRSGRKKERFYQNMVSISMMRFSAKSTTRNMCVIVLLLFCSLFAAFFGMLYMDSTDSEITDNDKAFAFHTPTKEQQMTTDDIYQTAETYGMEIEDFGEGDASNLVISYRDTDLTDDGKYEETDNQKAKLALFLSKDIYQMLTGRSADVAGGTYQTLTTTDYKANLWDSPDNLYEVMNPDTGISMALTFDGTQEYDTFSAMSNPYAYILNNEDYAAITAGITDTYTEHLTLFNVADLNQSYAFAKDLQRQYVSQTTDLSNQIGLYDMWEEKLAEEGEEYSYSGTQELDPDNAASLSDWKYAPRLTIVTTQDSLQLISVYVMLCLYIFIITLSAVGVMTYVRSISIATANKQLFLNLKKLGADAPYQQRILKKQLSRIFLYPGILGCTLGVLFSAGMSYTNDGRFTAGEIRTLQVTLLLCLLIFAILYAIYRVAKKKAEEIVEL